MAGHVGGQRREAVHLMAEDHACGLIDNINAILDGVGGGRPCRICAESSSLLGVWVRNSLTFLLAYMSLRGLSGSVEHAC